MKNKKTSSQWKVCGMIGTALCAIWTTGAAELRVSPGGLTPQQALEKIRAAKRAGDAGAWTVRVAPGVYSLAETLVLTPDDSGTPKAPVTWIGDGKETVFAGGGCVTGWRDDGDGTWSAPIPAGRDGKPAFFEQLWVNGRRADRARIPNRCPGNLKAEWLKIEKARQNGIADAKGRTNAWHEVTVLVATNTLPDFTIAPEDLPYAQMGVVTKWSYARRNLKGYDPATRCVTTESGDAWRSWKKWTARETIVCLENVRAGFDAPGEWFYDAKAGRVRYRPLPGEKLDAIRALAPSSGISQLVAFKGEPDKGAYVHDIAFRGIRFAATAVDGTGKPTQCNQLQAASSSDGAITLEGAHRVTFDGCVIANTGNYGMRFNDGCVSNAVRNCTLDDVGAGGIWMGARKGCVAKGENLSRRVIRNLAPRSTAFNVIDNCTIRGGGRVNPEGTGVALTHASDCRVTHCDIYDFYYTGVSVGWTWGFRGSVAQRNEIAFNRIWDLGKGVMSDMGGVYTLGTSYGTTVHDNVIHDVWAYSYGGWALYTDEGSEDITMTRNLCWNTTDGGFHQHYGSGCFIKNNIFAWNRKAGAIRTQRPEVQGIRCTLNVANNIVLVREGPLCSSGVENVGGLWAANLWWDVSGNEPTFGKRKGWKAWCASEKECGGLYADPLFVDAAHYDFRLKPDSPAFKLGFRAWDYSQAGRKTK